ncbi:unnamed protein product [Rhizopus stolonifer]
MAKGLLNSVRIGISRGLKNNQSLKILSFSLSFYPMFKNTQQSKIERFWKNRLSNLKSCIYPYFVSKKKEKKYSTDKRGSCSDPNFSMLKKTSTPEPYIHIPTRRESRQCHERSLNADYQFDRICGNEKTILLAKILQEKNTVNH